MVALPRRLADRPPLDGDILFSKPPVHVQAGECDGRTATTLLRRPPDTGCPVSKLLKAKITMDAKLEA
jgi:hypothetical protein